jgi:CheY-like chemotaxis protein
MDISDRQYPELAAILDRLNRGDRVRLPGRPARTQPRRMANKIAAKEIEHQRSPLMPRPARVARDLKDILLVDSNASSLRAVQNTLGLVADIDAYSDFQAARSRLQLKPPDLLVTSLRLQAYNGLHLVYLAVGMPTLCIAYADDDDLVLAREVQAAGAFYERSKRLLHALTAYVHATLPPLDRRLPTVLDRRQILRGGRRCTDKVSAGMRFL